MILYLQNNIQKTLIHIICLLDTTAARERSVVEITKQIIHTWTVIVAYIYIYTPECGINTTSVYQLEMFVVYFYRIIFLPSLRDFFSSVVFNGLVNNPKKWLKTEIIYNRRRKWMHIMPTESSLWGYSIYHILNNKSRRLVKSYYYYLLLLLSNLIIYRLYLLFRFHSHHFI